MVYAWGRVQGASSSAVDQQRFKDPYHAHLGWALLFGIPKPSAVSPLEQLASGGTRSMF